MSTFNSFAPILWNSFLFGLVGPWWSCNKRVLRVVSAGCLVLNLTALITLLYLRIRGVPPTFAKSFSSYLIYAISISHVIVDIQLLCLGFVIRRGINRFFRSLEEIDRLLSDVNIQMDHSQMKWRNIRILVLFYGMNALHLAFSLVFNPTELQLRPSMLLWLLHQQFFHQSFGVLIIAVVKSIQWRFSALNVGMELICTRQLMSGKKSAIMCLQGVVRRPTKESIFKFAILHNKLCHTLPVIGKMFGIQVVFYVAHSLILILLIMYQVFDAVTGERLEIELLWGFMALCKNVIILILMIEACTTVKREVKHSAVVVHRIVNCNRLWEFRKQLHAFSLQIYHCNPRIHFGMIEFNWNLLLMLFNLAFTYLFVLVQFNNLSNKKQKSAKSHSNETSAGAWYQ